VKVRNLKALIRKPPEDRSPAAGPVAWGLFSFGISAWLVLLLTAAVTASQAQEGEPDHPFRFGFSSALMQEVNENDSRAAMKVWVETLVKDGTVRADPHALYCKDLTSMAVALQNGTLDGVAVSTSELLALREQVEFNRYIFGITDASIFEEYVLLVHAQSSINRIEDLPGRSLNVLRHVRMSLAIPWLDTLLLEKGLKPAQDSCGRITEENKLTKTVLPVFFRQTDVCLVSRKGFKMMEELNPQVGRQLRVLASSPEFVAGGFFFRAGYPQAQQDKFVSEVMRVHTRPSGRQVLTVFQMDRLVEHPASVLDTAIALMGTHRRLSAGTNPPSVVAANVAPEGTKGAGR
jgi:ABC-type phosphate/phosphonate transport system substrate-binding protein